MFCEKMPIPWPPSIFMLAELIEAPQGCQLVSLVSCTIQLCIALENEAQHNLTRSFCYDDIISYVIRYGVYASWRRLFFPFLICDATLFTRENKSSLLSLSSSHFLSFMFTSMSICGPNIMLSMCLVLIFVIRLMLEIKPILQRSQMPNVLAYYFHA